jgi:hypothetical protein
VTRWKQSAAATFGLALLATAATWATERQPDDGPQWPNVMLEEPQWPNVRLDDFDASLVNPRPAFVDPIEVENRILARDPEK